jgi:tight adherence protein B
VSTQRKGEKSQDEVRKSLIKRSAIEAATRRGFAKSLSNAGPVDKLQQMCFQADLDWNAARVVSRTLIVAVIVGFMLNVVGVDLIRSSVVGVVILLSPFGYVWWRKKKRLEALVEQLPEVFDSIVRALRAGQSLPASIGVAAEQLPEPSRTEFSRVYQEQNLGVPMEDALMNMRKRLNQMDVSFFVTAVLVQKQSGGDLAEVLDNIGGVIRDRVKLFGQVKALTAEGRLSGWVLMALPPVMLLVLLFMNPRYINTLLNHDSGWTILGVAAFWQFLGYLMIRKIVDIEV